MDISEMSSSLPVEQKEVLELLRMVPAPPEDTIPAGATEDRITKFEQRTGLAVPNKLRTWLLACNGPCVGPGGVMGIGPHRTSLDIEFILRLCPHWREKGWIPLAGDGCGNYYVVATKGDFGQGEPVVFMDTMEDDSVPMYIVASDTWKFLRFLFKKELRESKWPFDRDEVSNADPEIISFRGVSLPWDA